MTRAPAVTAVGRKQMVTTSPNETFDRPVLTKAAAYLSCCAKKKGPGNGALCYTGRVRSGRYDILRLRAFRALRDGELDLLAFDERLEATALNRTEVCKYIRARFLLDEAEPFGIVEPFDGSGSSRHSCFLFNHSNNSPFPGAGVAGSDAFTDEKQDEVLQQRLLRGTSKWSA